MGALAMTLSAATHADRPTIQRQIDAAVAAGQDSVRIQPGVYRSVHGDRPAHVLLHDLDDFTVEATGVKLICTDFGRAIDVEGCTRVTLRGLTIDYDPLAQTQAEVTKIIDDRTLEFVMDAGYADLGSIGRETHLMTLDRVIPHDGQTLRVKRGEGGLGGNRYEKIGDRHYRFTNWHAIGPVEVGDVISFWLPVSGHYTIDIRDSVECMLEDVTIHSTAPGWTIRDANSDRITYRRVTITPGPKPERAIRQRVRAAHADGIHSTDARRGPIVEGCVLEHLGDDGVAIRGSWGVILQPVEGAATVELGLPKGLTYAPGDRLHVYRKADGTRHERTVVAVDRSPIPVPRMHEIVSGHFARYRWFRSYRDAYIVTLDTPITLGVCDLTTNPAVGGAGFVVRDNRVFDTRARGIIVKASGGVIEDNHVEHASLSGILAIAEFDAFLEASFADGLDIVGNHIEHTNIGRPQRSRTIHGGAISITKPEAWRSAVGHQRVVIRDNTIVEVPAIQVQLNATTGAEVIGNRFVRPLHGLVEYGTDVGLNPRALISLDHAHDIIVRDNQVVDPGPDFEANLHTTDNTERLSSDF
ncbi:MAG: hypothetical protein AAFY08_15340 [Planctomycetota bacterium]